MNPVAFVLVLLIAFLAGLGSALDEWQFHQPIVACTLIGLATGNAAEGAVLGASLQVLMLGWVCTEAAQAPDCALASIVAGILVCMKGADLATGQATAVTLALAGLALSVLVRTATVLIAHAADVAAHAGNIAGVELAHVSALVIQGLRVAIPALVLMLVPVELVQAGFNAIPAFVTRGLSVAGGLVALVGFAMLLNKMATPKIIPFFLIGFALSALLNISLIGMAIIGVGLALIYVDLSCQSDSKQALDGSSDDNLSDETSLAKQGVAGTGKAIGSAIQRAMVFRSQTIQGSWNYERMQNLGWCYSMIPALKKLYGTEPEHIGPALERHLELFNTHPYASAPLLGAALALEEQRAEGTAVDNTVMHAVKLAAMAPLAAAGDVVFWYTLRPIIALFAASLAAQGSVLGAVVFFGIWNLVRLAFLFYSNRLAYNKSSELLKERSWAFLRKLGIGACVLGMFTLGVLFPRWTSFDVSKLELVHSYSESASSSYMPYIAELVQSFNGGAMSEEGIIAGHSVLKEISDAGLTVGEHEGEAALFSTTTVQSLFDQLVYGFGPLLLLCVALFALRKQLHPLAITLSLFFLALLAAFFGVF